MGPQMKLVRDWWGTYWKVDGDPQLYEEKAQAEAARPPSRAAE